MGGSPDSTGASRERRGEAKTGGHADRPSGAACVSNQPAAAKGVKVDARALNNDLHGSPEYRAHVVSVMASRAVAAMT